MKVALRILFVAVLIILGAARSAVCAEEIAVALPQGVKATWDVNQAHREFTATRERICINGLWRWQPAHDGASDVPTKNWGYFKVPGCWPGITDYEQKDCQTLYAHPNWKDESASSITMAWYQREIAIPSPWTGRRIGLSVEYLNSYAAVYVDGKKAGEARFPGGDVDLSAVCRPQEPNDLHRDGQSVRAVDGASRRRPRRGV
jgi:beta-galactosidase